MIDIIDKGMLDACRTCEDSKIYDTSIFCFNCSCPYLLDRFEVVRSDEDLTEEEEFDIMPL